MNQPVESLVIVGGGTAGWVAAALIKARFGSSLKITLIESGQIATIGVGEASLPFLKDFLRVLRVDESEFLRQCDAGLKAGLQFSGWRTNDPDDIYYHLFFGDEKDEPLLQMIEGIQAEDPARSELWHDLLAQGLIDGRDFMTTAALGGKLLAQRKASKRDRDNPYESPLGYSYHIDAKLFADFLRDWCVRRGVRNLKDHVVRVEVEEDGTIRSVVTENQGEIAGDFFVDCSGFRGILINQALQEPFQSYGRWLLNDSAVAFQAPYADTGGELAAYTRLEALSAGWAWKIPLFSRLGAGYVYSGAFLSREEAEAELRERLGPEAAACEANHIRMRIGRNRRSWVNNCLSIGLASGFLEALESTSIALIQRGVAKFLSHFRDRRFDAEGRDRYNQAVAADFEECRDFIALHYCLTQREDSPFWRECRQREVPDRVTAVLADWREHGDLRRFIEQEGTTKRFFPAVSWYSILLGMAERPQVRRTGSRPQTDAAGWLAQWKLKLERMTSEFPDHRAYLAGLRVETVVISR